jgi:hypothetical protein
LIVVVANVLDAWISLPPSASMLIGSIAVHESFSEDTLLQF